METTYSKNQTTFTPQAVYFATPYNIAVRGFFFADYADFLQKQAQCHDGYGNKIEKFVLTYIGEDDLIDAVFRALAINQVTIKSFIDRITEWDENDMIKIILAVDEAGFNFDIRTDDPDNMEVDLYRDMTLKELAEIFIEEGIFGTIPTKIRYYIDHDKLARDLAHDYTQTTLNGENIVYRTG